MNAVYGIAKSAVPRTRRRLPDRDTVTLGMFIAFSALGGVAAGTALGAVGDLVPATTRAAVATLIALGAVGVGVVETLGYRVRLPQCDRETPRDWVDQGPLRWAAKNGLALGHGASSRIGFPLWYAVPCAALLAGSPAGVVIYGAYGLTRGLGALGIALAARRHPFEVITSWLTRHMRTARAVTSGALLSIGAVTIVAVGL
ncbi:MAG: hypothetical protein M3340_15395 [Actinomycetota bacterium]|nr:hypothetical protein [Actinomycetota bacterium]